MKQIVFGWLCALALGLSAPAWAQKKPVQQPTTAPAAPVLPKFTGKLATEPAQFIIDVQSMMVTTNNAAAKASAARLQQLWASNKLTATQQGRIVAIAQQMLARKFKPRPHFEALFNAVTAGARVQNFSDAQMDEFLGVTAKTLEREPVRDTERFLLTSAQFLDTKYLYSSRYNRLRVIGGTFSFAYNETDMPQPVVPAPPKPAAPAATSTPVYTGAPIKTTGTPAKKPAPKKKSSSGWDTADDWGGSGWGSSSDDDGWGTPKKKPAAKAPVKAAPGAKPAPVTAPEPEPEPAPSYSAYDTYVAPPTRGPVLLLKDADLFMATTGDSIFIRKVSGAVVPGTNRFVGQGGQYVWSIKQNLVTADFTNFDFDFTKAELTAQPMTLTYPAVLEAPIQGAFAYKSLKKKPGATDSGYPRFISLTNDARVKNIGDNIRYYGGFSLAGARTLSASLDGSLSRIIVEIDGKPKFRASSSAYVLGDSLISANRAAVTIFQDKSDSLTHPGVKLKFSKNRQVLQLAREEGLYKTTPYADSYHQMEIQTEMLTWPLRTNNIQFAILTAKNQVTANFESKEFYTNTRYQQIKSINKLHPLQMVVGYSQANGNVKSFTVQEAATHLKLKEDNVRSAVAGLARDGYVKWNPQTEQITLLPKAQHYVNSSRGRKDYDHIAIKSLSPNGKNATLDLSNNDLIVRGVDRFNFSDDSVTVFVKPDSSTIRIQKNRGVLFNGTVVASAFIFKGKEFKFDYDGFYVDLVKIDSIIVKGKGTKGSVMKARKESDFTLTNKNKTSAGRLYINAPNNKSGRKKLGAFPSFDASTGAYVFFNKPEVLGGAYDTAVYFDIPPFRLDSLNNKNRSAVGFKGTFVSGGIMPSFKTKLSLQEDGSLGFVYDVPKEGFPLYGGKGKLYNKVTMSNRGIQGVGKMNYLTGEFLSDQFIFYRDSVVTVGKTATIGQGPLNGVDFAKVTLLPGYQMKWAVKQDSMYLSTAKEAQPMKYYNGDYTFRGTTILTPGGLYGDGRMDGPQSFIRSRSFVFKPSSYSGKKSTLSIKSAEVNKPALTANEVDFAYDIKQGYADFARVEGSKASIDLPYSDYKTTLSGGKWDFKKKMVQMRVAAGADSSRSYFYSTKPEQKGLKFRASSGQYDLSRYRLVAGGVPYIAAADSWITPDSNKVYVLPNAQMRAFQNADIVMDSLFKYHRLYKGDIKVLSRTSFTGNALYSYKTAADSFAIKFSSFAVDSAAALGGKPGKGGKAASPKGLLKKKGDEDAPFAPPTTAVATIAATDKFHLAPRIAYRGAVNLNSQKRGFTFDGQSRLEFSKTPSSAEWFAVQDSIDPKGIRIRLTEPKSEDGTPMVTGLFVSDASMKVYPLFVAVKPGITDMNLFQVDGTLSYDIKKRQYTITRNDLSDPNVYEGSVLTLEDSTGAINLRGKLNLINSNKDYNLTAAGLGYVKPDSNVYKLNTFMTFDINMPEKAIEAMGTDMATNARGLPEALTGSQEQLYKMGEFIGSKAVQNYTDRKGNYVALQKVSPKFLHTLVLSQVNLRWSPKLNAWYSVGKIGLVSIGKKDINALIDGYIEIKKESTGDAVEMYLEAEPQTWYHIRYSNNVLLAKAQHGSFDEIIGFKAKGDYNTATEYGFYLGDDQEKDSFTRHFRKDFLGDNSKTKAVSSRPASTGNFDFAEDDKKKKKKAKEEAAANDAGTPPAGDFPTEDTGKKKKKSKDADPFDNAAAEPAPPTEDTGKKKKKEEAAVEKPAAPPAAPAEKPAAPAPTETPASADTKDAAKEAAQAKKEEERKAKEAEKLKKEEEKKAKEDEKKKKKKEDDPFGDS
ncbi:hypothetical protein SAMN02745146_0418 [Hymenobacter daecheongensis DSM 21074]|uniref:Uncharacterized protein n=1 Tax=Hymenobacter daecheongensis DSM 21074 TaxID=1121955 RepID=A0A1M6A015_9BACT|nr:hypothetical protein [Hymenobacter daecheongensis]SHI29706.1 hypothetical protein SAMN02745146_0418 [Hymenobacter daecheongensis DSM 21074]